MPIGTVYRAPPRKRSNHNLSNSNSSASGGAANEQPQSPTSPTLPAGRAQSDLEARIAEFNVAAAGATSPPPRPDQGYAPPRPASGSLPPKAPTSPMAPGARSVGAPVNNDGQYRNSAPAAQPEGQYYGGAAEPPRAETLRARNQPRPVAPAAPEPRAAPVRTAPVRAAPAPAMQTAVGTGQILIVYCTFAHSLPRAAMAR